MAQMDALALEAAEEVFASRAHAMADVFAYIETFYNPVRPHSSIGWRPPDAFARALSDVYKRQTWCWVSDGVNRRLQTRHCDRS